MVPEDPAFAIRHFCVLGNTISGKNSGDFRFPELLLQAPMVLTAFDERDEAQDSDLLAQFGGSSGAGDGDGSATLPCDSDSPPHASPHC